MIGWGADGGRRRPSQRTRQTRKNSKKKRKREREEEEEEEQKRNTREREGKKERKKERKKGRRVSVETVEERPERSYWPRGARQTTSRRAAVEADGHAALPGVLHRSPIVFFF